jgi:hypothetical protein
MSFKGSLFNFLLQPAMAPLIVFMMALVVSALNVI